MAERTPQETDDNAVGNISPASKMHLTLRMNKKKPHKYPAKDHCRRVAAQIDLDKVFIVLQGERAKLFANSDQAFPFRQDRYFYYLTGCNEPDCFATYDSRSDKLTLLLPPIDLGSVFSHGRGSTIEEAMDRYDIDDAVYIDGVNFHIEDKYNLSSSYASSEQPRQWIARETVNTHVMLKDTGPDAPEFVTSLPWPSTRLRNAMDACRAVKDDYELNLIRIANRITAEAHTNVLKQLASLTGEPGVDAVYMATCIARGAKEQAYRPIIGSGPNASVLHYKDNADEFKDREVLLLDAGAEWQHYASDVTRTMPINPKHPGVWASPEAKAVYKHVERIQEACIAQLRPGKYFMDVVWHSAHMAIDALLDMGILKGDHMEIFSNGVGTAFYPYGLGHHMGLEVHDISPHDAEKGAPGANRAVRWEGLAWKYGRFEESMPEYTVRDRWDENKTALNFSINPALCHSPSTPMDAPLAPGMVVTVEPGIYFNKEVLELLWLKDPKHSKFIDKKVLARYMHVGGVRIEDDILITEEGYENLTTAPKGEEMLRIIREGAAK